MNTKCNDPRVITSFNTLNGLVQFGIKHKDFIYIHNISINQHGNLKYLDDNNEQQYVSSLIKHTAKLQKARWLNHLYFIDHTGNEIFFKKYISQKHGINFT